jgi:hypothetical protein
MQALASIRKPPSEPPDMTLSISVGTVENQPFLSHSHSESCSHVLYAHVEPKAQTRRVTDPTAVHDGEGTEDLDRFRIAASRTNIHPVLPHQTCLWLFNKQKKVVPSHRDNKQLNPPTMSGRRHFSGVSQRTSWQPSQVRCTLEETLIPIAPISYSLSLFSMYCIRRTETFNCSRNYHFTRQHAQLYESRTPRCQHNATSGVHHVQKISCQGSQSDTHAVQNERKHVVSANYLAAT